MAVGGQLWYLSQGSSTDGRLAYINSDGTAATTVLQNDGTPPEPLGHAFPQDIAIDTAAGIYYVLINDTSGSTGVLLMGHIGSAAAPVVVQTFPADDIVNAIQIDPVSHRLYVSYTDVDLNTSLQGVVQFNYDPLTGATTPKNGTINNSFIVTQATANIQSSVADGIDVMAPRDFDLDLTTNTLYFTQLTLGDGFESNLLWKIDLDTPTMAAVPVLQQSQFPMAGDGSTFTSPNGFIIDVEVDSSRGLVYFSATEQYPGGGNLSQNAIWYIPTSASGSTAATKVTLSGPGFNAANFYPGDMALDAVNHILYVESEQGTDGSGSDDAVLVFQLNGDGTAATLINTISPSLTQNYTNLAGMTFNSLADLALAQNSAHAVDHANYTLLLTDPTITDVDGGYLASATVKISGSFAGSGDQLSVAGTTTGVISGTGITVAITTDGSGNQTLTLTGYDTIVHYQQVLGDLRFFGNNADPTNGGANSTRTVTWQVNDGTPGNPAGENTGQTVFTIDVTNDAPVLTGDLAATVLEGGSYTLTAGDIGFTDSDDVASGITFTASGLTNGSLLVNNVAATSFTGTQLAGGLVKFVHNGTETTTGSFDVVVEDGNEDSSTPVASTFNFTVAPVNDAPVLTGDLAGEVLEGGSYQLTAADLGFTDADNVAADVTFTVSNAVHGMVLVDGVGATSFTNAELDGGLVTFVHDGSEAAGAFNVVVEDGDEDGSIPVASTFNVTVTAVNDAPVLTGDLAATVLEGDSYTLDATDLGYADADDVAAGITFTVTGITNGTLLVDGVAASSFTATQLAGGLVTFVHDGGETTSASFDVVVDDGDEDGSTPVASTFNLTVTPVNDAPVLTGDHAATVFEGSSYQLTTVDLGYTDADDTAAGVTFTVSNLLNGIILVDGVAQNSFTGAELAGGLVTLDHDGSLTTTGSFDVSVDDGDEDGSTPVASTFNFTVAPPNTPPVLTGDLAATVLEGGSYTIVAADLGYTDAEDGDADVTFTVSSLVNGGVLVNGSAATSFTGTELSGGLVTFSHDGSETAAGSFDVVVEDGDEDGSTPVASTFNLAVTSVNDAPAGADKTVTVNEDTSYTFSQLDFGFSDGDGDELSAVVITTLSTAGTLKLDGVNVVAGQTIAAGDIDELTWKAAKNANGDDYASFTFQVVDDGGVTNGGVDTDAGPDTITFDVTEVVDRFNGNRRNNRLTGTDGDDILNGKAGNDKLTGGLGADTFVFRRGHDRDLIRDFDATDADHDTLNLSGVNTIKSFEDLMANHVTETATGVVINGLHGDRIVLRNVDLADLDAGDFIIL